MSAQHITSTFQTLLHPWSEEDTTPAAPVALEVAGNKIRVEFTDTQHEVDLEIDNGQPRILVYHPDCDEPFSIRWTANGFEMEANDLTNSGHTITLTT